MIYADFECLLKKMHSYRNNPEKSYTEKKTDHKTSDYSMFTNCLFDSKKTNLIVTDKKNVSKSFVKT